MGTSEKSMDLTLLPGTTVQHLKKYAAEELNTQHQLNTTWEDIRLLGPAAFVGEKGTNPWFAYDNDTAVFCKMLEIIPTVRLFIKKKSNHNTYDFDYPLVKAYSY